MSLFHFVAIVLDESFVLCLTSKGDILMSLLSFVLLQKVIYILSYMLIGTSLDYIEHTSLPQKKGNHSFPKCLSEERGCGP